MESARLTEHAVKPKLFQPNRALELSVFKVNGLGHEAKTALGLQVAETHPTARRLYGWGEISEAAVFDADLQTQHDDCPPRHVNIVGWPAEPSEQKQRQQLLASRALPVRLAPPVELERKRS